MSRVLVLCDTVGHDGGTESYLETRAPELARAGDEVSVFARRVETSNAFGVLLARSLGRVKTSPEPRPPPRCSKMS